MFLLVVCRGFWLVSISSQFFRKIEPWEGPICHLVPISRKMEIVGQVLAFLFSIIKGVGRVVTSCHSIEGCSSLDSVVLPSGLQSLAFDNVLSQTVPPLGLHSLTFSNSFDQRLDNMTLP
jgi:hypothetical protein